MTTSIRAVIQAGCAALLALSLAGCEQARGALGMERQSPDEFAVVARAPLSMPPDYRLRPPKPGAQRPQEASPRKAARRILLDSAKAKEAPPGASRSPGELALLNRSGALKADPNIRRTVDRESTAIAEASKSVLDKIVFWQDEAKPGVLVSPKEETRRLREASALGKAPNESPVPTIKRKKRGILEGLF